MCRFLSYLSFFLLLPALLQAQTPGLKIKDLDSLKIKLSQTTDKLDKVSINAQIAELYSAQSNSDSLQAYKVSAMTVLNEITDREKKEEAYLKIIEAIIKMDVDSFAVIALKYIENPKRKARVFLELDEYYYSKQLYSSMNDCLELMDSIKAHLDQTTDNELLVEYYYKKSSCYLENRQLLKALEYLLKAKEIMEDDFKDTPEVYSSLASIYQQLQAYDNALVMATKGKDLAFKKQDYFYESTAILSIIEAAFALQKYNLVKKSSKRAIDLAELTQFNDLNGVYYMLGKVALVEEKTSLAEEYFTIGLNYKDDLGLFQSACHEGLSCVWYLKNDLTKAKYHADQAILLYDTDSDSSILKRNIDFAKIYARDKDYKKAYQFINEYLHQKAVSDSLNNPYEIVSTLLNESFEQEKSILENELTFQKKLGWQNLMIGVGSAIIAFLIFLFFFIRKRNRSRNLELIRQVKEQTKEITAQKERLEGLDLAKSRLYTNITHEFRTPLTVISGIVEQMTGDDDSKLLIKRNSDQLLNLVNQMLDLRKLESGVISINKKQDDIVKFVRYLTESLKSYADMKGLSIHYLSDEKSILMDFDEEKITRIHSNLLSNAIKFTPKGGDIYVQLYVERKDEHRQFIMKIRDTGVGIPADKLPHVFERFYQVDDSSTRKGEGTGIGLTLVSELIKAMGGKVNVNSTVGEGTTFVLKLPISNIAQLADVQADVKASNIAISDTIILTSSMSSVEPELKSDDSSKPLALIVEDNADVIHYLINCLQDQYNIEVAMDGEEGIEKAITHTPDIIVSDVMMPIKDGFELCQILKADERTSHIPIILLTAKSDIESRLEGLQRGADAYLSKPFHQTELLIILQSQLALRKKLQQRFLQFTDQPLSSDLATVLEKKEIEIQLEVEDAFLQKIRKIIEKNLSDSEIGMLQLVRSLRMSRSQIYKKTKALTGQSPSLYIRSIRLHHAQKLLKTADLNVSEVAYTTGFSSPSYFSDVFFEEFGIRPNDTRK